MTSTIVDPAYAEITAGLGDDPNPQREVGMEPIPRFDYYHVRFVSGTGGFSGKKGTPFIRPTAEVLAGPQGTVGRFVSDDLYPSVSDTTSERDAESGEFIERPKSAEERANAVARTRKTLRRIAGALGFNILAPATLTEQDLQKYAQQFIGKEAIIAIRVEPARGNFDARNRFVFLSIASPTEAAKSAKYPNALAEAKERIIKADAKAKGKNARTVGGMSAPARVTTGGIR